MRKVLIAATIAFLTAIIVGNTVGQDSLLQAFTSGDVASQIVRGAIVAVLMALLLSHAPRNIYFRGALGLASAGLSFGVALLLSFGYIAALDALLYVEVAIIFALESMESSLITRSERKKIPIVYLPQNEKLRF